MAATATSLSLERRLRRQLANVLDAQTRDLVRAWAIAWDEIAPELRDTLTKLLVDTDEPTLSRGVLGKSSRLLAALGVVADTLADLAPAAGVRINQDLESVVDDAARAQARILAAQLPERQDLVNVGKRWGKRDLEALQAIVQRSTEQITALHRPLAPKAYQAVRRELVRSVAVGANPRATAARMVRRAEVEFNGGLTRALTISRTELVDAHRTAAKVGQDRHTEVLQGWVWLASLSPRTCRACLAMNGREFPLEEPGPLGHQQCRCARSPKVKPWADLGFDVEEPPSAIPDAIAYFERLTPDEQRAILGRKGYDAWLAGDFPPEDWAKKREGEGWRDSVVPASPDDAGGSGGDGPPGDPPSSPLDEEPEGLPIGPVLGTPEQQDYFRWPNNPMPAAFPLDDDSPDANNSFTFIADPEARAMALLEYDHGPSTLAKDLSAFMDMGEPPDEDWQLRVALTYSNLLLTEPRFGIDPDGANYTLDDFVTDLTHTADWLLDQLDSAEVLPTPLFRGVMIRGVFDLTDAGDVDALVSRVIGPVWMASTTEVVMFAEHYATRLRGVGSVVMEIHDPVGVRLDGIGRMSGWPEFLLTGNLKRVAYWTVNDILYVLMGYEL